MGLRIPQTARYELWRERQNPQWEPIAAQLLDVVHAAASAHPSFEGIPSRILMARGEPRPVKRLLVPIRSKVFKVNVSQGSRPGQIVVRRVLHPFRRSIEG